MNAPVRFLDKCILASLLIAALLAAVALGVV